MEPPPPNIQTPQTSIINQFNSGELFMLTKEILSTPDNTELVVIKNRWVTKYHWSMQHARPEDVDKAILVDKNRYAMNQSAMSESAGWYAQTHFDGFKNNLVFAEKGAKQYLFLVKREVPNSVSPDGGVLYEYALKRQKFFLGLWSDIEPKFAEDAKNEEMRQKLRVWQSGIEVKANEQYRKDSENLKESLLEGSRSLFGKEADKIYAYPVPRGQWIPDPSGDDYKATFKVVENGEVRLPLTLYMQLIEEYMELKYDNA